MLTVLILVATVAVGARTYILWKEGPWDLPSAGKNRTLPAAEEEKGETKARPLVGTEVIVSKNLFDPERGEGRNREVEANSRAYQRLRSMILLGTAILGSNRYAVLRDPGTAAVPGQVVPGQAANFMRLKLGDNVEGFRLAEIGDKRVVFTKGAANVEVLLDYFRKAEPLPPPPRAPVPGQVGVPPPAVAPRPPVQGALVTPQPQVTPAPVPGQVPIGPRVLPSLPRRARVPDPQRYQSEE